MANDRIIAHDTDIGMSTPHSVFRPAGPRRMGPAAKDSVVGHELKVYGIHGLRVIQASVFPAVNLEPRDAVA